MEKITRTTHVDPEKLRELIGKLDLGDAQLNKHIDARWIQYIEWWDSRSRNAKRKYHALRAAVIIAGALVPALVGLRELNVWGKFGWLFAVASILTSLIVAVCAGLETLYGYGNIWREKRAALEFLQSEGFSFLGLTGAYEGFKTHKDAYKRFAGNVEQLIRSEIKDYFTAVAPDKPGKDDDGTSTNGSTTKDSQSST